MRNLTRIIRVGIIAAALTAFFVIGASAAGTSLGVGTIKASALRLRQSPSTSSSIMATAASGDAIVILEELDGWYKVNYKAVEGYMSCEYLTINKTADVTIGYGLVTATSVNMRKGASTANDIVDSVSNGTIVSIVGIDNGWYKITYAGKTGYVLSDYLSITKETPSSRGKSEASASTSSSAGDEIVAYAKKFLGVKYVYGASSATAFDCSGFTQYVFKHFGYSLSRTAASQLSNGTAVSKANLRIGDLVLFKASGSGRSASHVGIYIGGNKFIHASSGGGQVKYNSLSDSWYAKTYVGARRIAS